MLPSVSNPSTVLQTSSGAPEHDYHGARLPAWYEDPVIEHRAVRNSAGLFDFSFRSMFSATGNDRARFLHNMVTNDVKGLTAGRGLYATMLDVRGHILADLYIYCDADQYLVSTDADLLEKVLATLNRYNIGGRVPLEPVPWGAVSVQGPKARIILNELMQSALPGPEEFCHATLTFAGQPVRIVKAGSTGEEGYDLWITRGGLSSLRETLIEYGKPHGLIPCGCAALETLRIEAGIPEYGAELGEDTLPLEAGLMNALSFTKGCYIGQEIVERARSRGHVNWKLAGLFVEAPDAPAPGEKLLKEGKPVGEITSACVSPTLSRTIAIGYVRREAAAAGTRLELASGARAEVTVLPF